jgi:hypothetical protein
MVLVLPILAPCYCLRWPGRKAKLKASSA